MTHPLVNQLYFARTEWLRAFDGVSDVDGATRFEPMNSLGWMMGHLAWQENICWNVRARNLNPAPQLHDLVGYGKPVNTPGLSAMVATWHDVTTAATSYLELLTDESLKTHWIRNGKPARESVGTTLQRVIYHYFFHIGEAQAVRQLLNHPNRPEYIGDIGEQFAFRSQS